MNDNLLRLSGAVLVAGVGVAATLTLYQHGHGGYAFLVAVAAIIAVYCLCQPAPPPRPQAPVQPRERREPVDQVLSMLANEDIDSEEAERLLFLLGYDAVRPGVDPVAAHVERTKAL